MDVRDREDRSSPSPDRSGLITRRIHDSDENRHATWLELFFDLVIVVAIARLGSLLHDDHSLRGVAVFAGLLVVIWWIWISFSYFADLFDDDSVVDRLAQLAAMLGAAILALTLGDGVAEDSRAFSLVNAALFTLLAALYAHAGRSDPRARELCRWYVAGSAAGASLWIASALVPAPGRYGLWAAAVLVNALISGPIAYARMRNPPNQASHMPERFGLFVIVVLGESILATVNGAAGLSVNTAAAATALSGFVIAASVWWLYFDSFDEAAIDRALAEGKRAQMRSFVYGYGHLLIYAAVVAIGIGVELAIEESAGGGGAVPLLGIGAAGVLLGFLVISTGIGRSTRLAFTVCKVGLAIAAAVLAALAPEPQVSALLLAAGFAALVIVETAFPSEERSIRG